MENSDFFDQLLGHNLTYKDLFVKPPGYEFHKALFTTFGLDVKMLGLLATAALHSNYIHPKLVARSIVGLSDQLRVFYDINHRTGTSYGSHTDRLILARSEGWAFPQRPGGNASYHPKIAVVCYKGAEGFLYSLLVTSRNLTGSDFLETGIIVETTDPIDRLESSWRENQVADDLVKWINSSEFTLSNDNLGLSHKIRIFYIKNGNIKLYKKIFEKQVKKAVATSPKPTKLAAEIDCSYYALKTAHCKMYFTKYEDGGARLWLGSANCTAHGLGYHDYANEECMAMVELDRELQLTTDMFQNYLEKNGFNKIKVKVEEAAQEAKIESVMNAIAECQCQLTEKNGRVSHRLLITYDKEKLIKNQIDSKQIRISLAANSKCEEEFSEDIVFPAVSLEETSLVFIVSYNGERRSLIAQACGDGTEEILDNRLNRLKQKANINEIVLPDIVQTESSKRVVEGNGSSTRISKSPEDGVYEELMKIMASGGDPDHTIKLIKEMNESISDEKLKSRFMALLSILEVATSEQP